MANGTSVTIANRAKTMYLGLLTRVFGRHIPFWEYVNKAVWGFLWDSGEAGLLPVLF
jgi:hypothetical protein